VGENLGAKAQARIPHHQLSHCRVATFAKSWQASALEKPERNEQAMTISKPLYLYARFLILFIFIVGVSLALFVKHWTDVRGLPEIESNVARQLDVLASQSPNLKGLIIVKKWRTKMVGGAPPFEGYIEYQAQQNNLSVDLLVYWAGDRTNCQITKIKSISAYSEPKILWEQQK
jgi:hypothetical protein